MENNVVEVGGEPSTSLEEVVQEQLLVGMKTETSRSGRRRLRVVSAAEKVCAIDRVKGGEKKAAVARDLDVPESTLRGWCKSEQKIRGMVRNSSTPDVDDSGPSTSRATRPNKRMRQSPNALINTTVANNARTDSMGIINSILLQQMDSLSLAQTAHLWTKHFMGLPNTGLSLPQAAEGISAGLGSSTSANIGASTNRGSRRESSNANNAGNSNVQDEAYWPWLTAHDDANRCLDLSINGTSSQSSLTRFTMPGASTTMSVTQAAEGNAAEETNETISADQAIYHAEKFVQWLEMCSDPSVTRFQIIQFKHLLDNLKSARDDRLRRNTADYKQSRK